MSDENRDLVVVEQGPPPTLFGTTDPNAIVARASEQATALARVIDSKHLYATIGGRKHVTVEGWTLLGAMLGVFPVLEWSRPIEGGWEARVEARTLAGALVGAAEAQCTREEKTWASRDDYALRSMAQTRATSKAMRLPLSFVMTLAGYDATPAEEMPHEDASPGPQQRSAPRPPAPRAAQPDDERLGSFASVGDFYARCMEELKLNGSRVRQLAGTGNAPGSILDYEGGLDMLYIELTQRVNTVDAELVDAR